MVKRAVWAAVLAVVLVSVIVSVIVGVVISAKHSGSGKDDSIPLDMAENSVDDMYSGCEDKMEVKVRSEFLPKEKKQVKNFSLAWNKAEEYYNSLKPEDVGTLKKEQIMAIHAYTLEDPQFYNEFNTAVRTQRSEYYKTFSYHTMHFFLTTALQTLNSLKPEKQRCLTGFRRTNTYFSKDALNKEIRFSSFTSSSMGSYIDDDIFGNKTCFNISTCFGVDISKFSTFGESEREVLIPPYEIFKVKNIERIKSEENKNVPCKFEFELISTERTMSNLNCGLFSK